MKSLSTCIAALLAAGVFQVSPALAQADLKSSMKENNDNMASMQMTGNPDVDFAMMMREHHAGALPMAEWELKNGKSPAMREMARKIIAAQKKEIAQFDAFLAKNGHGEGKGHSGHAPAR